MAKTVKVELSEPRVGHGGASVTHVVLREPTLDELFLYGEPIEVTRTKSGEVITIEHPDILNAYRKVLIVEPDSQVLVGSLPLVDALRVKDEIIGFFLSARLATLPTSPTDSSST
jgi:hypothetical protein